MGGITYDLKVDDLYYSKIQKFTDYYLNLRFKNIESQLKDLSEFISIKKIENIRSLKEYYIEYLLIGMFWSEYIGNALNLKKKINVHYKLLNALRDKINNKEKIDNIRGKINYKLTKKSNDEKADYNLKNYNLLLNWLECTGDFKEEIYRLKIWKEFFKSKESDYVKDIISSSVNEIKYFYKRSLEYLGEYTKGVKDYLLICNEKHKYKEDIIYCGKGEVQYFLNMFGAEIMNRVYSRSFKATNRKIIFLPRCMNKRGKRCVAKKMDIGSKCSKCSKECNIYKIEEMSKVYKYEVVIIEHESSMSGTTEDNIGIVGIACLPNLLSGGWKALRLGFVPQCVILNYSGCEEHWRDNRIMTEVQIKELIKMFK